MAQPTRALAEREMKAQSLLDADRWGFNFKAGAPKTDGNSRWEWQPLTEHDVVPEPYALRGMPYLRKHAPGTPPRKLRFEDAADASTSLSTTTATMTATVMTMAASTRITGDEDQTTTTVETPTAERTPPQEPRVPEIGQITMPDRGLSDADAKRKRCTIEPTTPVLPPTARKQASITDYMKSRKRGLNGTTKSMIEPPEKIARNAGQIRS